MPTHADHLRSIDSDELAERTFLVRGGSGAVGVALCRRLAAAGAKVAVAVHKPGSARALESELAAGQHLIGVVPTGDGEAAAGFVKGTEDSLGPIDAFISTAGAFTMGEVGRTHARDARAMFEANFLAVHDLVRAVVGPMTRRKSGTLVLTGARAVGAAIPGMALYLAAKSALHAYADCLREEVAPAGLQVAVIAPGIIDTPANRDAMPDGDRSDWDSIDQVVTALLAASAGNTGRGKLVSEL